MNIATWTMDSPVGTLVVSAGEHGLRSLRTTDADLKPKSVGEPDQFVSSAIEAYFSGALSALSLLPVDLSSRGMFARAVLEAMQRIEVGELITYSELAAEIGRPTSARAVGQAVGANPLMIVIPCHRVVAANGSLGGYSGGLWRKRWLLDHEGYTGKGSFSGRYPAQSFG